MKWAKWVEENVDPNLTSGYFISVSPMHFRKAEFLRLILLFFSW
jgi:hypothetical protein